jgi:hypothetical protein
LRDDPGQRLGVIVCGEIGRSHIEEQFNAIAAELLSLQLGHRERLVSCSDQQSSAHHPAQPRVRARNDEDAMTRQAEALLARLHPIEQAIMAMAAHTIAGLGVKARHAACCGRSTGER